MEKKNRFEFAPFEYIDVMNKLKTINNFVHLEQDEETFKFQEFFRDIEVKISYSFKEKNYSAEIKNQAKQVFHPTRSELMAKDLDTLISFIEFEARSAEFTNFVGYKTKNKIIKELYAQSEEIVSYLSS